MFDQPTDFIEGSSVLRYCILTVRTPLCQNTLISAAADWLPVLIANIPVVEKLISRSPHLRRPVLNGWICGGSLLSVDPSEQTMEGGVSGVPPMVVPPVGSV